MRLTTTCAHELRGVEKKVSKKTNKGYFVAHFEDCETFQPFEFFVADYCAMFPEGTKKGDCFMLELEYDIRFKQVNLVSVSSCE